MSAPGRTFFERLRITLTWCYTLCIGILAVFGESQYQGTLVTPILFMLGGALAAVGAFGRLWCSLYISGYKNNTLISEGPYSLCRNPLYFFSFIGALGIGLSTGTLVLPAMIIGGFAIYYPLVVSGEEARLAVIHGERFQAYLQQTPAFFPRVSSFREPVEYTVRPKIYRKDIGDAVWFVWAFCLLHFVAALRAFDYIPTLLNIY